MSREIEEIRAEGYAKGRAGICQGICRGICGRLCRRIYRRLCTRRKKEMANRLNDFGLPVEQIAQALNADVSMVQEWLADPQLPKEQ